MDYSFNSEIAKLYGVDEAVFIHNLYWWIAKNEANGRHFYDGKNWTYNSMEAFTILFPFWTVRQVRRIINKLETNGIIYIGNYNQRGFDRTQWYALDQTVTSIYSNGQMQVTKRSNASDQTVTPIPDSKPYINTDSKLKENTKEIFSEYTENADLIIALSDYEQMRKSIKSPLTDKAKKLLLNKLDNLAKTDKEKIELLNDATLSNWKSVYARKQTSKTFETKSFSDIAKEMSDRNEP
jgi:hypothetical protein